MCRKSVVKFKTISFHVGVGGFYEYTSNNALFDTHNVPPNSLPLTI